MFTGVELKIARIRSKIKQIDLAKLLGISFSKLSMIENEHCKCPEDVYHKTLKILQEHLEE